MIKHIVWLVIILMLVFSPAALAAEPGSGIIEGQLVNRTEGGGSVADQEITLKTYLNDTEKASATTRADTEGRFVLADLATTPDYSYELTVTFQEADYTSERLSFNEGELSKSTELIVYDSTMSAEAIKLDTTHMIVYVGQGSLEVIEFFVFSNESDRTYIGTGEITATGTRRTLSLPLPDKTTDLQYGGELMVCCVVPGEEGFFDTMPVLPGNKDIVYSYKVDYNAGAATFSQRVNYPTLGYTLLVQGESVEVTSNQLVQQGLVEIEGSQFKQFSGANFAPGDTIVVQLSGLPQTSRGPILWVALTLVVLAGGFGLNYWLRRKRLQPVLATGDFKPRKQKLLVELAQLDDDFKNGKIHEEVYRRLRAQRKAELVRLIERPKENSGRR